MCANPEPASASSRFRDLLHGLMLSHAPRMRGLRRFLLALICVAGLLSLAFSAQSLVPPYVYMKDFIQEYLLARAVLTGENPYLPLPVLAAEHLGALPTPVFPHPTPHPPPVALLALPLGWLDYELAARVWFVLELLFLAAVCGLLLRTVGAPVRLWLAGALLLTLLMWSPVSEELAIGQLMLLLLLCLTLLWRAVRAGDDLQAGIFLGAMLSLKLMGWPLAMWLALQRKWRALAATAVTVIVAHIAAALLMGWQPVVDYYLRVGGEVAPLYQAHAGNFSLWTVGWRLLDGTGSPVLVGITAPPLIAAPSWAPYLSLALPVAVTGIGLLAARGRDIEGGFGVLLCLSLLVNPVAWSHYLTLTLVPLTIAGRRLLRLNFPASLTVHFVLISLLLWLPRGTLNALIATLGAAPGSVAPQVPFVVSLLSLLPAVAVLGLAALLWRLSPAGVPAPLDTRHPG